MMDAKRRLWLNREICRAAFSGGGIYLTFEEVTKLVLAFRDERDWKQFHNPKDLALSLNLEAAELLEVFQWSGDDLEVLKKRERTVEELADVAIYCIYLADALNTSLSDAIKHKLDKNATNYPVRKAKGTSKKYSEL